jgi:hypothetical protein
MKILVDGKELECDRLEIISEVAGVESIAEGSELHMIITSEGLIMDLWEVTTLGNPDPVCSRTFSSTYDDLVDLLK